jgi:hypothetical protein
MDPAAVLLLLLCAFSVPPSSLAKFTATTVAGQWSSQGLDGDGLPAHFGKLFDPQGLCVDPVNGHLYIGGRGHSVRKVDGKTGLLSTFAGTGTNGNGATGLATATNIGWVNKLTTDASGNVIFTDSYHVVRRVDAATNMMTTIAGTGVSGFTGDGGPATSAKLNNPFGVVVDNAGRIIIADNGNSRIRAIETDGTISTIAGTGTWGISGNGGLATAANMRPNILAIDKATNTLFVGEGNSVRRIDGVTKVITTVLGTGVSSSRGPFDGSLAATAAIREAYGVALDSRGRLLVSFGHSIILINETGHLSYVAGDRTGYSQSGSYVPGTTHFDPGTVLDIYYDISVYRSLLFFVSTSPYHTVSVIVDDALFAPAVDASACNFTGMARRDLVGTLLNHTTVASEDACRALCCADALCEGYSLSSPLPTAHYAAESVHLAQFWRRVADAPPVWHTSCFLMRNVTHSVHANAMQSAVRSSLLL